MKKIIGILTILSTLILASCGNAAIKATTIVATSDIVYINVDKELKIEVSVLPSDATNKDLAWVSRNEEVVTVTQEGVIKGIKLGKTTIVIKLEADNTVSKTLDIHVVDQNWPIDVMSEFASIALPSFEDFTNVEVVKEEDVLTLYIKGSVNPDASVTKFKDALVLLGWSIDGSFDTHFGKLKHETIPFVIQVHNEFADGGDLVEIKMIKVGHENPVIHTWLELNAELLAHFGFEIDEITGFETITLNHLANHGLEIVLSGITDQDLLFHDFEHALEDDLWIASTTNTHHAGRFDKENVTAYITYHEGHSDQTFKIEIIHIDEHH